VVPIFYFLYLGNNISILFVLIFVSVILELTSYKIISDIELKNPFNPKDIFRLNEISANIAFALSAFSVSLIWIAQTNLDKFLVFNFVSLEDYGRYSVAMVVSGGFIMLSQPLTQYLHPYFTSIFNEEFFRSQYEKYSLLLTTFLYLVFIIFALSYSSIMGFWLKDMILVESIKEIVLFFSLGNILMLNSSFIYLMQYAKGDLTFHIKVSLIVLISYGFFLYISLKLFGINGPGYAWLLINFIYLNFAAPFIHKHLTKFYMFRWQGIQTIASIFFIILVVGL
jgi:O-antigen/teichoic acid export membrane protein